MRNLVGTYDLLNRQTGTLEDANLYDAIDEKNLTDFEKQWRPAFVKRLSEISTIEEIGAVNLQDAHWMWREKIEPTADRTDYRSFAIECSDSTQGLMFLNLTKRARESSQKNSHLVYIELLATAPWNRKGFTAQPIYKGVGRILITAAISYSVTEEFKGRIGLQSLPQSESWYRDVCGMTDLGPDPDNPKLRYFEMTEAQATAYLGKN